MEITIKGEPNEIADLVLKIQERQELDSKADDEYMLIVNDDEKTMVLTSAGTSSTGIVLNAEKARCLSEQLNQQIQLWSGAFLKEVNKTGDVIKSIMQILDGMKPDEALDVLSNCEDELYSHIQLDLSKCKIPNLDGLHPDEARKEINKMLSHQKIVTQ